MAVQERPRIFTCFGAICPEMCRSRRFPRVSSTACRQVHARLLILESTWSDLPEHADRSETKRLAPPRNPAAAAFAPVWRRRESRAGGRFGDRRRRRHHDRRRRRHDFACRHRDHFRRRRQQRLGRDRLADRQCQRPADLFRPCRLHRFGNLHRNLRHHRAGDGRDLQRLPGGLPQG